jgi:DNA-binding GntR family transcriptional regulator
MNSGSTENAVTEVGDGETLVAFATRELKRRILGNEFAPGYSALEPELALLLGISRTPLREALSRLEQDGLIEIVPRRGMRVLPISAQDMAKLYALISALECLACELVVARKLPRAALKPLADSTREMGKALKAGDLAGWARADGDFHARLIELADNEFLSNTINRYWDQVYRVRMFTLHLRPRPVHSTQEHRAIVEAILEGNATQAVELNRVHRKRAAEELTRILERFPQGRL